MNLSGVGADQREDAVSICIKSDLACIDLCNCTCEFYQKNPIIIISFYLNSLLLCLQT